MLNGFTSLYQRVARLAAAALIAVVTLVPAFTAPAMASGDRTLYIHYTHTNETARITFKRNGRYVQDGLNQLNVFLRDWRRNEPANMDPALFDLLWEVYQATGSSQPIHVVSAYRSPATNAMLRNSSSGVAENSQHMSGRAIDFYIPGVPTRTLREIGLRMQVGGVGYYPTSNSPFVHLDTGSVRAWPRLTTAQLRNLFPDGQTLHVSTDGTVLSQQGRQVAQAHWNQCRRVPCGSGVSVPSSGANTQVAEAQEPRRSRTLMDIFFGGGDDEVTDIAEANATAQAPAAAPAPTLAAPVPQTTAPAPVRTAEIVAPPSPPARPASFAAASGPVAIPFQIVDAADIAQPVVVAEAPQAQPTAPAPTPPARPETLALVATAPVVASVAPVSGAQTAAQAIAGLDGLPPIRPDTEPGSVLAAYAPSAGSGAALDATAITASAPIQLAGTPPARTQQPTLPTGLEGLRASLTETGSGLDAFASLFEGPITPPQETAPAGQAATENAMASVAVAPGTLYAPDLSGVETLFLGTGPISGEGFGALMSAQASDGLTPAATRTIAALPGDFSGLARFGAGETIWVRLQ